MTPDIPVPNIEAMLQLWMLGMIRPGAAFLAAPVFGAANVPVQLRLVVALAVGVPAVAASGMALPADGIVSVTSQDSAAIAAMALADCLIRRPAGSAPAIAGDMVDIIPLTA